MKIKWFAHACFLIEGDGLRIITDPYDPVDINVPPVTEPADIVIRSSSDDIAHAHIDTIPPGFELITATEIADSGVVVNGVAFKAIWSQESLIHKEIPRDNAMYRFTVEGIHITHLGDIGNALTPMQMEDLQGTDVLLALTGGPPTIDLDDLYDLIQIIKPKVIIPMHYRIPGPKFHMLPVEDFIAYFAAESVEWLEGSEIELHKDNLPEGTRVMVLPPAVINR